VKRLRRWPEGQLYPNQLYPNGSSQTSFFSKLFSRRGNVPQGLKAIFLGRNSARLKPCPFKAGLAFGTAEVVHFQTRGGIGHG